MLFVHLVLLILDAFALIPNPVESLPVGQRDNPAPVEFVIRFAKKALLNQKNNSQSRLDSLLF